MGILEGGTERSSGERSEAERSVGPSSKIEGSRSENIAKPVANPADPEVAARPKRRTYTAEYKLNILRQADACKEPGQLGALLRREGLYHSNLITWCRQREEGTLSALTPKKRGRKAQTPNPLASRVAELERENRKLKKAMKKAETIIEIQKNLLARPHLLLNQKLPHDTLLAAREERPFAYWRNRARKKSWSGGGCGLDSGDAVWRSRLGK
jgi:transposase